MVENMAPAMARAEVVQAVAVAIHLCGVDNWTPVTTKIRGPPKPNPRMADEAIAAPRSPGWIVVSPIRPAVKMTKAMNSGSRMVRKRVLMTPQTGVEISVATQHGCESATTRMGSEVKRTFDLGGRR